MLEVETLGPLATLAPGADLSYVESWYLFDGVSQPETEEDVVENVEPLVAPLVKELSSA
jgi:hypothetical protein